MNETPRDNDVLRRRLVEPEGRSRTEAALARDPELARRARAMDRVLASLDAAGEAERAALLEEGGQALAADPELAGRRGRRGLLLLVAAATAAAAVVLFGLRAQEDRGDPAPRVILGAGDVHLLRPVGPVEEFDEFHWDVGGADRVEFTFELRIWRADDDEDAPARILRFPEASPWRPQPGELSRLGDAIRWEIVVLDTFGESLSRSSRDSVLSLR